MKNEEEEMKLGIFGVNFDQGYYNQLNEIGVFDVNFQIIREERTNEEEEEEKIKLMRWVSQWESDGGAYETHLLG